MLAWEDIAAVHSQSEESFRCWLMVVHRNVVYKQMRHALAEQRDPGREQPLEPGTIVSGTRAPKLQDKGTSPSTPARRHEQRDRLTDALETLSEKQRHVVRLRYLEELSCREIEKETGMSPGAIQRQLRNGLANLRKNCNTDLVGLITKLTTESPA